MPPPISKRRIAIADACIHLLSTAGMHGLSHSAIDRHLELPAGSTSYYFRSREALIQAATERLVALDDADLEQVLADGARPAADASAKESVSTQTAALKKLFESWSAPERRERLAARFELLLAGMRGEGPNPLLQARRHFVARTCRELERTGMANAQDLAQVVVALFDGLLLDVLVGDTGNREIHLMFLARLEQMAALL